MSEFDTLHADKIIPASGGIDLSPKALNTTDVAQVGTLAVGDITRMTTEVKPHLPAAEQNYKDFQNGGWKLLALYNTSGEDSDTTVRENQAVVATDALHTMPTVQHVIGKFFPVQSIVLARLARLEPGGKLWEHVDYSELRADVPRLRYHIPLVTEPGVAFVSDGQRVHMATPHVWSLNPRGPHGVTHDGSADRLHIIIDAKPGSDLALDEPILDPSHVTRLDAMTADQLEAEIDSLTGLIRSGMPDKAVAQGLDLFYTHKLPAGATTHLAIAAAFAKAGDNQEAAHWAANNDLYMNGGLKHA